jgi:hypothetical protein
LSPFPSCASQVVVRILLLSPKRGELGIHFSGEASLSGLKFDDLSFQLFNFGPGIDRVELIGIRLT